MTDTLKTYQASCHCGAVRFEADIDLAAGSVRCNCSICAKLRLWSAIVTPDALRLLAGSDELTSYRFLTGTEQHLFCKHCGVRPYGIGNSPHRGIFYCINLACLDNATPEELCNAPISYIDGKNDAWDSPPTITCHL